MDKLASGIMLEYQQAIDDLNEEGLLIDLNYLVPQITQYKTILSWSNNANLSYLFSEYSQLDHYRAILENRDYSFCFADGGIVQIRYDISDKTIIGHRLSFFPCPYTFTSDETIDISLSELPLYFSAEELRSRLKLISPIRFDYDAELADERHSPAHFTINKDSCRVPAYGPVSLGHFIRFVLRYFYETEFASKDDWDELKPRLYLRTLHYPPPHELHIETAAEYC